MGAFSAWIPQPYRLLALAGLAGLALAGLALAMVVFGWVKGASHVQAKWDAATQQQSLRIAAAEKAQAEATVQVVTQYVDRVNVVRQAGETLIKEIPIYVTPQADSACIVPRGFVRLHDAAATGVAPEPAGDADAAAAGVELSAVAGTVASNYTACRENAEQLMALQAWVGAAVDAAD